MKVEKKHWILIIGVLIVVGSLLRFYKLDWDEGYYLHPDERLYVNALSITWPGSWAEFWSPESPLNPHMFYYGTFPLYMYKLFAWLMSAFFTNDGLTNLLFISRATSALFNVLSLVVLARLALETFNRRVAVLAVGLMAFFPAAVQVAHFNTTESFLLFFSVAILYSAIKLYQTSTLWWVFVSAVLVGLAASTKIVGISYGVLPALALLPGLWKMLRAKEYRNTLPIIGKGLLLAAIVGLVYFIASPYSLIAKDEFLQQQVYMQSVITGDSKPPFVIIYEGTTSYLYYLVTILPWQTSPILAPLLLLAWGYVWYRAFKTRSFLLTLIAVWPTAYFVVSGDWYAKFSRYLVPILPYLALFAGIMVSDLIDKFNENRQRLIIAGLLATQLIAVLAFMNIYADRHTRIRASEWLYDNTPVNARILGEHWDDPLPLLLRDQQTTRQVDVMEVYNPESTEKWQKIGAQLEQADYVVLSSRRVYESILRNEPLYPVTTRFYELLFNGDLGFRLAQEFTQYPAIAGIEFNTNLTDESFQSYDHPPVLIFMKNERLSSDELLGRVLSLQ